MLTGSSCAITAVFGKMSLMIFAMTSGFEFFTMPAWYIAFGLTGISMVFTVYNLNVNLALYS